MDKTDVLKEEDGDSESSLDSIEKDELKRKLHKMAGVISMWKSKKGLYKGEVRRLLTINGNFEKADSIFSRLEISPEAFVLDELLDEKFILDDVNNDGNVTNTDSIGSF